MKIKEHGSKELMLKCVELISKTLVELGQVKDEKHIVILSSSLTTDLFEDFSNLYFEDVQQAFRQGVRKQVKNLNDKTKDLNIETQKES